MENAKQISGAGEKAPRESPSSNPVLVSAAPADGGSAPETPPHMPSRTPFTNLSQVDADLALARALQEQERAYLMLRMNGGEVSDYVSSEEGDYEDEEDEIDGDLEEPYVDQVVVEGSDYGEDAFDANEGSINPDDFVGDEEYARALQDAEERDVAVRLMALAGLDDWAIAENVDRDNHDQDAWREVDPDELSYEELVALSEVVGTESRGLSMDTIASLPSVCYKAHNREDCNSDQCVICRLDFEDGDSLVVLSCKHKYHTECINKWLQINKICPVCSTEVSTSCGSQAEHS